MDELDVFRAMLHQIKLTSSFACMLAMSSCATVFVRSDGVSPPTKIFPATVLDAEAFWFWSVKGEPLFIMGDPNQKNNLGERLAYGAGAVIDCPFSVVSDVIYLPTDIVRMGETKAPKKTPSESAGSSKQATASLSKP